MRFDTPIYFQTVVSGEYNAQTGNYGEDSISEIKRYADVTDTGTNMLNLLFGKLKQGSLTIRLQQPFNRPFSRIRIGSKLYNVDFSRRNKNFVVSEIQ